MKRYFILALIAGLPFLGMSQSKKVEDKIELNKKNNKPELDGIIVEYSFKVDSKCDLSESSLKNVASFYFENVVTSEIKKVKSETHFVVTTKGHKKNDERSKKISEDISENLVFHKKNYYIAKN